MVEALSTLRMLDDLGFSRYVVSLKDSDRARSSKATSASPKRDRMCRCTSASRRPACSDGVIKTRIAFEQLLSRGIGDTIRVSLTLPFADKWKEVEAGNEIIADIEAGRFRSVPVFQDHGLNIISCPSCSRVENEAFVDLAFKVKEISAYAKDHDITIAVMGCRVNGPGETDDADLGLWCAPTFVNLKKANRSSAPSVRRCPGPAEVELDAIIERRRCRGSLVASARGQHHPIP